MPAVLAQPAADSYQEEIQQETVQYSSRYSYNRESTPLNDGHHSMTDSSTGGKCKLLTVIQPVAKGRSPLVFSFR